MKTIVSVAAVLLVAGCAIKQLSEGQRVRLVDSQQNCEFVNTVVGSEDAYWQGSARAARSAMNDLRNRTAAMGGNAVRVLNAGSDAYVFTAVGEALICDF